MNRTRVGAFCLTFLMAALAGTAVRASAQTNEETLAAAENAFKEAAELSESGREEAVPLALEKFQTAQQLYRRVGEKRHEANAWRGVGRSKLRLNKRDEAISAYEQALKLFQEISRTQAVALVLVEIAEIYGDSRDEKSARSAAEYFDRALPLLPTLEDKRELARALANAGRAHLLAGNRARAIELSKQALPFFQGPEDRQARADIHAHIGHAYEMSVRPEDRRDALDHFMKAAELYPAGDSKESRGGKANALLNAGNSLIALGRTQEAVNSYNRALELYLGLNYLVEAALAWDNIGSAYVYGGRVQDAPLALNAYLEAARIYRDIKVKSGEAEVLSKLGDLHARLRRKEEALRYYEQARVLYESLAAGEPLYKPAVAKVYGTVGAVHEYLGGEKDKPLADENYRKARAIYQELYESFRRTDDRPNKQYRVTALRDLADVSVRLKDRDGAIEAYRKAITACKEIPDEMCEATMLTAIGNVYFESDDAEDNRQAVTHYLAAKQLFGKNGNKDWEVWSLRRAASAQRFLKSWKEFLTTSSELLKMAEALEPPQADGLKAETNIELGEAYRDMEDQKAAVERLEAAYALGSKLDHEGLQSEALANLIQSYFMLGDAAKVMDRSLKFLAILTPLDDSYNLKRGFGHAMLGYAYGALGDNANAKAHLQKSVEALQQSDDKDVTDMSRVLAGNSYLLGKDVEREKNQFEEVEKGLAAIRDDNARLYALYYLSLSRSQADDYGRAMGYAEQALSLARKTENRSFEALFLLIKGFIFWEEDKNLEGVDAFQRAAAIFDAQEARLFEVYALTGLMVAWRDANNPRLAIFYGKQGVKLFQELRRQTKNLDNELQKGYVKRTEDLYRDLVALLLSEGRPDEAQQVINLARDQSFYDLGDGWNQASAEIQFTPRELEHSPTWKRALTAAGGAGAPGANPSSKPQPGDEPTKLYDEYLSALRGIGEDFKQPPGSRDKLPTVSDVERTQAILRDLGSTTKQKTAVLYTFVGDNNFYVLLNTLGDKVEVFSTPVKSGELNRMLLQFYALLQSKVYDPRPLGKVLYDIIIPKGLEARLRDEGVEVLVWSLDGNLRYVPMAALSPDGKQYLVERYGNVVVTRVEADRMLRSASPNWTGYGFFTSEPRTAKVYESTVDFIALDKGEKEVFRTKAHPGGIIGGETFSDLNFTKATFLSIQKQRRPVIHVSSHFRFYPGDPDRSFLLLGDGQILPMSELKQHANIFQGVELLTLSACDTAAQFPNADGKEIDGFAELAQRLGAGSVMASLWSVSDISTTRLMKGFYTHRQGGRLNKAEALRKAQLDLLHGRPGAVPDASAGQDGDRAKGDPERDDIVVDDRYRIKFAKTQRFSHPYYWSPFVLFGNWQ